MNEDLEKLCEQVLNESNKADFTHDSWVRIKHAMWHLADQQLSGLRMSPAVYDMQFKYTILRALADGLFESYNREKARADERDAQGSAELDENGAANWAEYALKPVLEAIFKVND